MQCQLEEKPYSCSLQETDLFINDYIEKVLEEKPVQQHFEKCHISTCSNIYLTENYFTQPAITCINKQSKGNCAHQSQDTIIENNNNNGYEKIHEKSDQIMESKQHLLRSRNFSCRSNAEEYNNNMNQNACEIIADGIITSKSLGLNSLSDSLAHIEKEKNPFGIHKNYSKIFQSECLKKQRYTEMCFNQIIMLKKEREVLEQKCQQNFRGSIENELYSSAVLNISENFYLNHPIIAHALQEYYKVSELIDNLKLINIPIGRALPVYEMDHWEQVIHDAYQNGRLEYNRRLKKTHLSTEEMNVYRRKMQQLHQCFRTVRTYLWYIQVILEANVMQQLDTNFNSFI
ncbi:uncharacterized protein LOC113373134 isoform X2 [Ctenocephalides felis]|uniref:uncharacterized protein LOC113373134 isoform X2 n=1 Tax=Ctenocephalides felis TaxID=7515 RepID=UPI000E6E2232|nr:uncharacterized protein LOC113373134 isoform X2 [Ctenocephalides felis]